MGNKTEKPSIAIYRISGPPLLLSVDISFYISLFHVSAKGHGYFVNNGINYVYILDGFLSNNTCQHSDVIIVEVSSAILRNDLGFDSRWGRCKNRASCPLQGTVNWGAVSK